jgi:PiT family inorganic phosphate transporter
MQEILLLIAGIYLAWSLGANDATNVISTAVGSKTISFRKAMVFLVVCLGIGAIFLSGNVIKTVSSGIVPSEIITINHAILALLISAGWVHFATWKKLPVSISQAVVSSVFGIGLAESIRVGENLVELERMLMLAGVWLFSPVIGFLGGWIIFKVVHGFVKHKHLYFKDTLEDIAFHPFRTFRSWMKGDVRKREHMFKFLLLLSAGYMAIALGANTIATTTGLIYSGLPLGQASIAGVEFANVDPLFVLKIVVLLAVVVGMLTYGKHLVDHIGMKLRGLNTLRGAIIQASAATVILVSALLGYPLSTTSVFVGTFLGVDSGEEHPKLQVDAARGLKMSFFVTIPVTAVLAGLLTWVLL